MIDRLLSLMLDRRTLRLLAGNCRLREFNMELTRSLECAADEAGETVSVLRFISLCEDQSVQNGHWIQILEMCQNLYNSPK